MTKTFEKWAKENKYKLDKERYKPEMFTNAWIYTNTHTQSAWQAWEAALTLYGINEGEEA